MKYFLMLIVLAFFLTSCEKSDDVAQDQESHTFSPASEINILEENQRIYASIVGGSKLVFKYKFSKADNPQIADDEFSEEILFEIAPDLEHFSLNEANFAEAKAMYAYLCFCDPHGYFPISGGTITGKKLNSQEWLINIDIRARAGDNVFSKTLSGKFIQK